jgi:predicted amidohydrolase YtcJ
MRRAFFVVLLAALLYAADTPDVIYYHGHIVTLSAVQPEVQAVAIQGNHFLRIGSDADIRKLAGPNTKLIDLHGRTVLPGLEDSHTHPSPQPSASAMDRSR